MRVVVLSSSPYSETSCATAVHLAELGYVPVGVLTLPSWDRQTLVRKVGQWGLRESLGFARTKLMPGEHRSDEGVRNPHLQKWLRNDKGFFRKMGEVGKVYGFPVVTCIDQNSPRSLAQLKRWTPDVLIFTGGNLLRDPLLRIPRLGVLNSHLGLLPEIRGMSCPEWSLLCGVPLGITIHFIDNGIDTGPVLLRKEFQRQEEDTFSELRNRMIAEGINLMGEALTGLAGGTISAIPQSNGAEDHQYFVMHEALKAAALRRLKRLPSTAAREKIDA